MKNQQLQLIRYMKSFYLFKNLENNLIQQQIVISLKRVLFLRNNVIFRE